VGGQAVSKGRRSKATAARESLQDGKKGLYFHRVKHRVKIQVDGRGKAQKKNFGPERKSIRGQDVKLSKRWGCRKLRWIP